MSCQLPHFQWPPFLKLSGVGNILCSTVLEIEGCVYKRLESRDTKVTEVTAQNAWVSFGPVLLVALSFQINTWSCSKVRGCKSRVTLPGTGN